MWLLNGLRPKQDRGDRGGLGAGSVSVAEWAMKGYREDLRGWRILKIEWILGGYFYPMLQASF